MAFDLENYIDVKSRIKQFRDQYPNGSLQPLNLEKPYDIVQLGDSLFIVYAACAYRSPDDPKPGIGIAMERYPGRTNYTRDSELMNAETSAWGRAIVAALAVDTQSGIASLEEVRNRHEPDDQYPEPSMAPQKRPATNMPRKTKGGSTGALSDAQLGFMRNLQRKLEISDQDMADIAGKQPDKLLVDEASALIKDLLKLSKNEATIQIDDAGKPRIVAGE